MRQFLAFTTALTICVGTSAYAEPLHVEAVMAPKEVMQLDFKDGSKHFVTFVHREGQVSGEGALAGSKVTEYGMHDITPGIGGDPRGYLEFIRPDGAVAYVKWRVRAVFIAGADGKQALLDNGYWEIVGATGGLAGLSGAGTLHIKPVSQTDRRYILEGELSQPKR
jgi:hypothetical protein